ncbi:hypothetical protein ABSL23_00770 (plasmid) [Halobacterium sp. NMX12-1]|uniref:Uncharacterized protein n=1 Tax=Halobacterium sp. NMX12-1 TaxID=3166650 RepID=A0AAU8C8T0_9EURY
MIRTHLQHLHHAIDEQTLPIRAGITLAAVASLPLFGNTVRALGAWLGLGRLVLPLLILAHVPAVVGVIAIWSIGCDLCRTEDAT